MRNFDLKIAGICGIIAPIVTISLILVVIHCSNWFSWYENALSDLGSQNGNAACLFNWSLIVCGILIIPFAFGIRKFFRPHLLGSVGGLALSLTAIALLGIGTFPINTDVIHFYFSVAFFILLPISLFIIGIAMIVTDKSKKLGLIILILSICSAVIWALPKNGVAVHEFVSSVSCAISCLILGIKLITA